MSNQRLFRSPGPLHNLSCVNAGTHAGYTTGDSFTLASNYTTDAVTVAGVAGLCQSGAPVFPVVEATISSVHKVWFILSQTPPFQTTRSN